ncbi:carbohydrate-binding domain-containing protein [Elioraea sp.]|uniref:carbohydrate-binding domain-containing protein n=1 Tax=Elioraea sp. TaxID=2185103 RepID=UPI0025B816FA|nr:carbohydrate-binding domain-containing protein [Elioraea sp.]
MQNAGTGTLQAGVTTMGQVFQPGDVPAGQSLIAKIGATTVPVQVDVKTTHPDGSIKMAVLSFERPMLGAGTSVDVVLEKAAAPAAQPVVNLAAVSSQHSLMVELTPTGQPKITIDVMDALRDALADGSASIWQKGPLATQARVEVDVPGSMRLKFDVTAFKDGNISVDAMFNNDEAMEAAGGRVAYSVKATLDGKVVIQESVNQGQYQNWMESVSSGGPHGGQGLGAQSSGWLNIQHDIEYLKDTGAIANYDLSIPVSQPALSNYGAAISASTWSDPLASNGVMQAMPTTGGRPDIGFTTQHNVHWLLSGDARAAEYAMGQAEASGAVPWNFWDDTNDTWLNTDHYAKLWTDPRGGTGRAGDGTSTGLTQQRPTDTGWTPDHAHQPDLSSVPYMLTGERWMLDNLQAQASAAVMGTFPVTRMNGEGIVTNGGQVRGSAWNLRQVENAAWLSPDGSAEQAYFETVSQKNWDWLISQIPAWTAQQGEAHGYLPGAYPGGAMAPWQQDYFAGVAIISATRGGEDAKTFIDWMSNYLVGRFTAGDEGFAMRDAVAYNIAISNLTTREVYKTWEEIGAETVSRGMSNTTSTTGWASGEYGRLGLATLAGIHDLTGDSEIAAVYRSFLSLKPAFTDEASYVANPAYAITIPEIYDEFYPPAGSTPATKPLTLPAPVTALNLEGTSAANMLIGGAGADIIRGLGGNDVMSGGAGRDSFVLGRGAGNDRITDFASGTDRLFFDGIDPASLKARIATVDGKSGTMITYGTAGDSVFLTGARSLAKGDLVFANVPAAESVAVLAQAVSVVTTGFAPVSRSFGTGNDTLVLRIAQDAWQGSAQYQVLVNGQQFGGTLTASALRSDGTSDTLTLKGNWGTANTVEVRFLNDAWGGTAATDRNLYVQGMSLNGQDLQGMSATLATTGGVLFAATKTVTPQNLTFGSGSDTMVLKVAQDFWQGNAQYTIGVNGQQIGGVITAASVRANGQSDTITIKGNWGDSVQLSVNFLNDGWGGSATADRNLHLNSVSINGIDAGLTSVMGTSGARNFTLAKPVGIPEATFAQILEGTTAANTLVGGAGADLLRGGAGADVMTGGAGADTFLFASGAGADRITDFASGTDRLFFQGIASASVQATATTVNGTAGVMIAYGSAGDTVFLAGVTQLAAGDLVFG